MSNRIVVGTALLLTLGTAVAGTFLYGQAPANFDGADNAPMIEEVSNDIPSVEMMEAWKANAVASTYIPPKLPI